MSDNFISLSQAKEYTKKYRESLNDMLTNDYKGALSYCETFDANAIKSLLDQEGCVSFRAYYGLNENNQVCSIFVGVDENFEDILSGEKSIIVDRGHTCPDKCPSNLL